MGENQQLRLHSFHKIGKARQSLRNHGVETGSAIADNAPPWPLPGQGLGGVRMAPVFAIVRSVLILGLALSVTAGCGKRRDEGQATGSTSSTSPAGQPLFGNLGSHHRKVTTQSPDAQKYFDQGLILVYSFNHDEAIRSFKAAAELDSTCAMAYWGISLANGPHINNAVMDEAHSRAAWQALKQAEAHAGAASATERELIQALAARYADPIPEDRKPLDLAYANAMRTVWKAHPEDADLGALSAEALMDLRPWDLWTQDAKPQPGTEEILATLDAVLRIDPNHPLANHLYVHALEASPEPERAVPAADRLRTLVPGAGHMVHMPAHIYSRVGRWADAAAQNVAAVQADREYRARSTPEQGFYRIYMAHNHHFLAWASMMEGRSEEAIRAAREMIAGMPPDWVRELAFFADGYMAVEMESLMRFGRWEEILVLPEPPEYLPITATLRHSTRGVALAASGRLAEAKAEQKAFETAAARVTEEMVVGNNSALVVLDIARHLLAGEVLAQEGKTDAAVKELAKAVELEDGLRYNEAPDWMQPVRHALGAVLVRAGRFADAEQVYREDLKRNQENGWALYGLARCLRERGATEEAAAVEARFTKAWSRADVTIKTSCFCQAG
jgi:tetratricopeptide (TPR) repeat protein